MKKPIEYFNATVLFSGRFDPPHIAHAATITRLSEQFKKVVVIVLHNKERRWPADFSIQAFEEIFKYSKNVEFVKNTIHFGKITKKQLGEYHGDYYASGNVACLNNVTQFMPTIYTDRAYGLAASGYKDPAEE